MKQTIEDVACPRCGCVCDDLRLTVQDGQIREAAGACHLARPWFLDQNKQRPAVAQIEGRNATLEEALARATEILVHARWPLICGLAHSSTPGQRAAAGLAEQIQANIDPAGSQRHAASTMALQEAGASTCTLGEVRHRADLVIFWGADPVVTHPRHLERYSADPVGEFLPRGRADRTLIVIDSTRTQSAAVADEFIQVEPGQDFEALWTLRCLVRGIEPRPGAATGIALKSLQDLAARMLACRSGVIFYGGGASGSSLRHRDVEALLSLVRELNSRTRFYARAMGAAGGLSGAEGVLCWQTGYPAAVNLTRNFPRYNPGEYSAEEMLQRGEVDACLIVGSEAVMNMSTAAQTALKHIPTIVLDPPTADTAMVPTVRFTTAVYGIHLSGTAYRMDDVPIPLRNMLETTYPSDGEVLEGIRERVGRIDD